MTTKAKSVAEDDEPAEAVAEEAPEETETEDAPGEDDPAVIDEPVVTEPEAVADFSGVRQSANSWWCPKCDTSMPTNSGVTVCASCGFELPAE